MNTFARRARFSVYLLVWLLLAGAPIAQSGQYVPPAGAWAKKAGAELGLDAATLAEAVTFAQSRETIRLSAICRRAATGSRSAPYPTS